MFVNRLVIYQWRCQNARSNRPRQLSEIEAMAWRVQIACEQGTLGFGFTSDLLRKWHEFFFIFSQTQNEVKQQSRQITFDTQLKTAVFFIIPDQTPISTCKLFNQWKHAFTLANWTRAFQIAELEGLDQKQISTYQTIITENNINGKVLSTCDLNELGQIMTMTFGDWQLFRAWVLAVRNPGQECTMWYVYSCRLFVCFYCFLSFFPFSRTVGLKLLPPCN